MHISHSLKILSLIFIVIVLLVAVLFWGYLHLVASMQMKAERAQIELPKSLSTKIHVENALQTHAKGVVDTKLNLKRHLDLPIQGKYLSNLKFNVKTMVNVSVDYHTMVRIDESLPLKADTDLIYQKKYLPRFPITLNLPIKMDVPFHIKQTYRVPVQIFFDGPVYMEFNERLKFDVNHQFRPKLKLDNGMQMEKIATFNAIMVNRERQTKANLEMKMELPLDSIRR